MLIQKAMQIKAGQTVRFPADRGEDAGKGEVLSVGPSICKNMHGTQYLWVTIKGGGVWPSHRLL